MYPIEGVTSHPQAVTAGRPTHVKIGKLFSHATYEETRVYTPAAAKVHSSMDQALAHSPVSSEVSAVTGRNTMYCAILIRIGIYSKMATLISLIPPFYRCGSAAAAGAMHTPHWYVTLYTTKAPAVLSRVEQGSTRTLRVEPFQGPHSKRAVHSSQAGSA
jgi:hypothetical protein